MEERYIVIFDGVCNLCNGVVNFIIKRDPEVRFSFTPIQSEIAEKLMSQHGIENDNMETFVVIKNDAQAYTHSDAALELTKGLSGYWHLLCVFKIIPRFIRDGLYKLVARNRYKLLGKREVCMVPTPELKSRFLDEQS